MIRYDTNGTNLFFLDALGVKYSRGPNDGQAYQNLLDIMGAQKAAAQANKEDADDYRTKLAFAQASEDASRPGAVVPQVPKMTVVDDYGKTSHVAFDPPLPVFVPKVVSAPSTGKIAVVTPDRMMIMQNQVSAIYNKLFPEA